jgi:hypothetical protein
MQEHATGKHGMAAGVLASASTNKYEQHVHTRDVQLHLEQKH